MLHGFLFGSLPKRNKPALVKSIVKLKKVCPKCTSYSDNSREKSVKYQASVLLENTEKLVLDKTLSKIKSENVLD